MTELEQRILDIIQDGFPITERPYAAIADMLNGSSCDSVNEASSSGTGVTETAVFETVGRLRESGVVRRIGGVYDTKQLGLISRLCAGRVPSMECGAADDSALEKFAASVDDIPAITHNYVRSHSYNVWFTVICENEIELQSIIDKLCAETALRDVHCMPAKKMFKINTVMSASAKKTGDVSPVSRAALPKRRMELTEEDKCRIRFLSGDLPQSLTPFSAIPVDLEKAREDLEFRRMRRFGAVLRHQKAGFPCNAMVCFDIGSGSEDCQNANEDRVASAGEKLAANPHVSHCYERPPFEGFPYNVYAMFHAQTPEDLLKFVGEVTCSLGNPPHAILHSKKELKKTSYKYFA